MSAAVVPHARVYLKTCSYIDTFLARSLSSPQGDCTRVEHGTLQDISASAWTRLCCAAGRSGGESPRHYPPVPRKRTADSLSQPHGLVHDAAECKQRFIPTVRFPAQSLTLRDSAKRMRMEASCARKLPAPTEGESSRFNHLEKNSV